MKVKVIKDAFYNKTLVRDGEVIEANFDKKHIPSWAVPITETKKQTPIEVTEQSVPVQAPTQTTDEVLEHLKDIAIEHDIFLTIAPNMTVAEQIEMFKTELKTKGIAF